MISSSITTGSTSYTSANWGVGQQGFAIDPSIPANAKATRVVMADRPVIADETNHKKTAIAVYADGHVSNITRIASADSGSMTYMTGGASAISLMYFPNNDSSSDNIYSDSSDGPMDHRGAGSTTRCWLR